AHCDHGFATRQGFARVVGVQRAHRAVVAGIHGLQQVKGFGSANFADDDTFRTHAQAVADQFAHSDLALAFEIRRARLEAYHVRLLELQFGGVFTGDDALVVIDELSQAVEQRGFARAGATRHQCVDAAATDDTKDFGPLRRDRAEFHELVERQLVFFEFADGEGRTVNGQRRHDTVDARTVRQARVADW